MSKVLVSYFSASGVTRKKAEDLAKENIFGLGDPNDAYAKYFIGNSYLNMLAKVDDVHLSLCNVTFEPGCRNN